jgi:hypothetical protein
MPDIKHAERNQKLSNVLFEDNILIDGKKCFDWVVTVSFYSAIHFVESFILPKVIAGQQCKNINEVKKAYKMDGRHQARERLVWDYLSPKNAAYYNWLDDKSRYSRYTTYKVTITEAEKAQQYLKSLAAECTPPAT